MGLFVESERQRDRPSAQHGHVIGAHTEPALYASSALYISTAFPTKTVSFPGLSLHSSHQRRRCRFLAGLWWVCGPRSGPLLRVFDISPVPSAERLHKHGSALAVEASCVICVLWTWNPEALLGRATAASVCMTADASRRATAHRERAQFLPWRLVCHFGVLFGILPRSLSACSPSHALNYVSKLHCVRGCFTELQPARPRRRTLTGSCANEFPCSNARVRVDCE